MLDFFEKNAKGYLDVSSQQEIVENDVPEAICASVNQLLQTLKSRDEEIEALGYELEQTKKENVMTASTGETMTLRDQITRKCSQMQRLQDEKHSIEEKVSAYKQQIAFLSEKLQKQQESYQNLSDNMTMMLTNLRDHS